MEIAGDTGLEFLDLKLKISGGKVRADVFAKSTCYPKNNICNIPRGIAVRIRRICDGDETFEKRSSEYQSYLIARDHKTSLVKNNPK